MAIEGIDVHAGNGAIEWHKVLNAGKRFAFVRAAYGDAQDAMVVQSLAAARAAGMVCGAYHFVRVTRDADTQIDVLLKALASAKYGPGDLPPAIDVEDNPKYDGAWKRADNAKMVALIDKWITRLKAEYGRDPVLYTRTSFWVDQLGDPQGYAGNPLWIARYASSAKTLPSQWPVYSFWQYSESGSVAGVPGHADLDRFNGAQAQLDALRLP